MREPRTQIEAEGNRGKRPRYPWSAANESPARSMPRRGRLAEGGVQPQCRMVWLLGLMSRKIVGGGGLRNGVIGLRVSGVLSVSGFIALAASLYEVDRREKSSSGSAAVNLIEIEQQVQILGNQIRILSTQLGASERQGQALSNHIQALDLRLKELEDDLRRR